MRQQTRSGTSCAANSEHRIRCIASIDATFARVLTDSKFTCAFLLSSCVKFTLKRVLYITLFPLRNSYFKIIRTLSQASRTRPAPTRRSAAGGTGCGPRRCAGLCRTRRDDACLLEIYNCVTRHISPVNIVMTALRRECRVSTRRSLDGCCCRYSTD